MRCHQHLKAVLSPLHSVVQQTLRQVSVDGQALAFIEDQRAATFIHNSVVAEGSSVRVR